MQQGPETKLITPLVVAFDLFGSRINAPMEMREVLSSLRRFWWKDRRGLKGTLMVQGREGSKPLTSVSISNRLVNLLLCEGPCVKKEFKQEA